MIVTVNFSMDKGFWFWKKTIHWTVQYLLEYGYARNLKTGRWAGLYLSGALEELIWVHQRGPHRGQNFTVDMKVTRDIFGDLHPISSTILHP